MVLERLVSVRDAVLHPQWMFVIGGVVSVISFFISYLVFPSSIGMFATFLTTFAITPFMVNLITYEEVQEEEMIKHNTGLNFLTRHKKILEIYAAFFAGMILFLAITFLLLPQQVVQQLFNDQITEIQLIRGDVVIADTFTRILVNNIGVLSLAFIFSLLFGAGAVFILSWNATVLSSAIGLAAQNISGAQGVATLTALPAAVLIFLPHGSLEILAYFIGGIAGGILSTAISRRQTIMFRSILIDSLSLLVVAALILVIAAVVETSLISLAQ